MNQSFLDPQQSSDGTPYSIKRYTNLIKECWYISDQLHTSYTDVLDMSVMERVTLIDLINEKQKKTQEAVEKIQQEAQQKKRN
jgi:hypothetical protein